MHVNALKEFKTQFPPCNLQNPCCIFLIKACSSICFAILVLITLSPLFSETDVRLRISQLPSMQADYSEKVNIFVMRSVISCLSAFLNTIRCVPSGPDGFF